MGASVTQLQRFVRCRHCQLPHLASVARCPFSGEAVDPQTRLPDNVEWRPSREELTGTLLDDRYLVGQRIGEGAMGSVYRSEHIRLGTTVAVKVLHGRFESGSAAEKRFLREGQSAGRVEHPNVVRVFDVGRLPDGAPYIVMEHLEGVELSAQITPGGLSIQRVLTLAEQLLQGLACAHSHRVIHRDIKPDNIFLARSGGEEVLKILDFSIAKDQSADTMTRDGDVLGTPQYLAPEQASGRPVDGRVDLWAAGVVIYELLTGKVPFHGQNLPNLILAILKNPAKPPSQIVAGLTPAVDAFFEKALAKDAADRFQDAGTMWTALRTALAPLLLGPAPQGDLPSVTVMESIELYDTLIDET
jgi:serine/threonine protein kinase